MPLSRAGLAAVTAAALTLPLVLGGGPAVAQEARPEITLGAVCRGNAQEMLLRQLEREDRRRARNTEPLESPLPIYVRDCRIGDILSIPEEEAEAVAHLCDFDRAIVRAGGSILCVFSTIRLFRFPQ